MPNETVILNLGRPNGIDGIAGLPGFKSGEPRLRTTRARRSSRPGSTWPGRMMPGRWYGYDAAQVIVVDTNDRERSRRARQPPRQAAGRLGRARRPPRGRGRRQLASRARQRTGPILPGEPTGRERVTSLEALDMFAGSNKPITPPGTPADPWSRNSSGSRSERQGAERDLEPAAGLPRRSWFRSRDRHRP